MNFFEKMIEVAKSMGVKNFAYYKKWALDHLKKQLEEDKQVTKAIEYCEEYLEKAYGVGTIRTWKGKKYIKGPDKKWRRYYDKKERGTSIAIAHIMKQINALEDGDVEGLYAIIQKNAGRFRDQNGNVLPEVQQIHDLVEKKQSGSGSKKEEVEEETEKEAEKTAADKAKDDIRDWRKESDWEELAIETGKAAVCYLKGKKYTDIQYVQEFSKEKIERYLDFMRDSLKELESTNEAGWSESTIEGLRLAIKDLENLLVVKNENEDHENRSKAMLGNDNAKKDGVGEEWDESYFKANVDGIKNKLKDKSETEVKKYFTWLDKQFADKPENSYEKRAIAQAKADYYGDSAFKGTDLETVAEKYASDKELKNTIKKTDSMSFTSTDVTRSFLSGTYQEDGYKIATNAHILSMVKEDYPKEDEGKIKGNADQMKYIGKKIENLKSSLPEIESKLKKAAEEKGTGSKWYEVVKQDLDDTKKEIADLEEQVKTGNVNAIFPNYKKVIPSMGNAKLIPQEGFEDFNKVFKIAKIAAAYGKKDKEIYPTVRVGNKVFNADYLVTVMAMAKKHGLNEIVTTEGEGRCVEFKGDNGSVVIMPMTNVNDTPKNGEFNANTGAVNISDPDKAEEFLSGGEKETSITFAKNKTKYEKKFDKDVIDIMNHFHKQKGMKEVSYGYDSYLRAAKMPDPIKNENNEDYTNAMNDLKSLYHDYQGFVADVYNRRYAEEGKANKDISSKEIKTFFEDGIKKIKDKYGIKKSYLEQIEEISKAWSQNGKHLEVVTDKNGHTRKVWKKNGENGGIKKSFSERIADIMQKSEPAEPKHDLEYYKKWALSILDKQKEEPEETVDEPNEETVVKALIYTEMIAKAGYPVGTIREWKGKKYIKIAPNQWKPKYDKMDRGAKMSLSHLKKAVAKCDSEEELFNLINTNASRFRDENGHPLPEVQELHDIVTKRQAEINPQESGAGSEETGKVSAASETTGIKGNNEKKEKMSVADKIAAIQKMGKKGEAVAEKLGSGNVEGVAEDAGNDTINGVKNAVSKNEKQQNQKGSKAEPENESGSEPEKEMTDEEKEEPTSAKNFTKLQLKQAYNMIGMKGNKSLDQLKADLEKYPDSPKNKAALMLIDKLGKNGDTQENMDKLYESIENGTVDSFGNNKEAKETFESLSEQYKNTTDPDEREKILEKMTSLDKEDEKKILPAMAASEDESFAAWDKDQKAKYGNKTVEELQNLLDTKYKGVKKYTNEYQEAMKIGDMIQQKKQKSKKDEEGLSNRAEDEQDKRIGGSALWDQHIKNAIKSGNVDRIKTAIAQVENEYNELSKKAKYQDEKEFLMYELKFRKRDAENAIKELQNK